MAMAAGGGRGKVKSDINVTPLVDVVLVLLIIFMVVTPLLQRGKDVKLPEATKQKEKKGDEPDPMIVSLTSDKKIFLEKDPFDEEGLKLALQAKLQPEPWKQVLFKADSSLEFGEVRKVLSVMQKAGAKAVKMGVQESQK
jgi:biopolymer transport protein ExbD/biopolymer transport protein TolR